MERCDSFPKMSTMKCSTRTSTSIASAASKIIASRNNVKTKLAAEVVEVMEVREEAAVALEEEAIPSLAKVERKDLDGQAGSRNRAVVEVLSSQLAGGAAISADPKLCQ